MKRLALKEVESNFVLGQGVRVDGLLAVKAFEKITYKHTFSKVSKLCPRDLIAVD